MKKSIYRTVVLDGDLDATALRAALEEGFVRVALVRPARIKMPRLAARFGKAMLCMWRRVMRLVPSPMSRRRLTTGSAVRRVMLPKLFANGTTGRGKPNGASPSSEVETEVKAEAAEPQVNGDATVLLNVAKPQAEGEAAANADGTEPKVDSEKADKPMFVEPAVNEEKNKVEASGEVDAKANGLR